MESLPLGLGVDKDGKLALAQTKVGFQRNKKKLDSIAVTFY